MTIYKIMEELWKKTIHLNTYLTVRSLQWIVYLLKKIKLTTIIIIKPNNKMGM